MGVTKQAAQKRFVAKEPASTRSRGSPGSPPRPATSSSRRRRRRAPPATTRRSPRTSRSACSPSPRRRRPRAAAAGVTPESLRAAVVLPAPAADVPALIPYDATAKKALELTFREAVRLGAEHVGTEHVLLALLEVENGDGPLTSLGLTKGGVEAFLAGQAPA